MRKFFSLITFAVAIALSSSAQKFIHPGINQTAEDLEFMRQQALKGEQPWKDAFDRLKAEADLKFGTGAELWAPCIFNDNCLN